MEEAEESVVVGKDREFSVSKDKAISGCMRKLESLFQKLRIK